MRNQSNAGVKAQWFETAMWEVGETFLIWLLNIYIEAILMTQLIVSIKYVHHLVFLHSLVLHWLWF